MKFGDVKDNYTKLWNSCVVTNHSKVDSVCKQILANKPRYDVIASATQVPWFIVGCVHNLECDLSFKGCLHNGNPWNQVTTDVPKGLGPWKSFEEAAIDALKYDGLVYWHDWSIEGCLYKLEGFNGYGYYQYHVNSPYLWSFTNAYNNPPQYLAGKYVSDRVFDPKAISDQVGCAAILKQLGCFATSTSIIVDPKTAITSLTTNNDKLGKLLQQLLNLINVQPMLVEDGSVGPKTLAAINDLSQDNASKIKNILLEI